MTFKLYPAGFLAAVAACGAPGSTTPGITGASGVIVEAGPDLSAPRATHAMVALSDGRLLAIGGCVADGCEAGAASATVDIIAPGGKTMQGTGQLRERRVQPSAIALPDDRVLVLGGWVDGRVSRTTEIFDARTGRSVAGPVMESPRASPSVALLADGRVLIAGGYDGNAVLASAEIFDPAAARLSPAGALGTARSGATASLLPDGRVLVAGGGDGESAGRQALASAELFDPETLAFAPTGTMAQRRYKHGAVVLPDGDVLLIAGSDERDYAGKLRSVERYDIKTARFSNAGSLARPRFKLADGVLVIGPGRVLIGAGDEQPEIFDISSGRGELVAASLDGQWNYQTLRPAGKRTALLAGGYREGRIEPTKRSWLLRF